MASRTEDRRSLPGAFSNFGAMIRAQFKTRRVLSFCLLSSIFFMFGYMANFSLMVPDDMRQSFGDALSNTVPLLVLAYATIHALQRFVFQRHWAIQTAAHIVLMQVFAVSWYLSVIIVLGLVRGSLLDGFSVNPFRGAGFTWQMFQGATVYALIAAAAYAFHFWAQLETLRERQAEQDAAPADPSETLILRHGDEFRPVEVADILLVSGAGDYAEVTTLKGTFLSRKTLGEFESLLPPGRFVRIHRSRIVNLDAIQQAEPAGGGRLTLQLPGGSSVETSRAGARLLRERSI